MNSPEVTWNLVLEEGRNGPYYRYYIAKYYRKMKGD